MQKNGIINSHLAAAVARLRHMDLVVVADSGLPVPPGVEVVDLAVVYGLPSFSAVLAPLLDVAVFEAATAATEIVGANPTCWRLLQSRLGEVQLVPHTELKRLTGLASLVVRTGEASPYANVVLQCGVPF